jgi:hypothetical protein
MSEAINENCYDSSLVGTVGDNDWNGCSCKLIVDRNLLQDVIGAQTVANGGSYTSSSDILSGIISEVNVEEISCGYINESDYTLYDVSTVFTGQVTDFSWLFASNDYIDDGTNYDSNSSWCGYTIWDISEWDLSNATTARGLFDSAESFNQDISSWDVSNIETFSGMFNAASDFNQDIGSWNVSSATEMDMMFNSASSFDQDLSSWCVTNISEMPAGFDTSTLSDWTADEKPGWGTCTETCYDDILNQDEEDIDCGGTYCDACDTTSDAETSSTSVSDSSTDDVSATGFTCPSSTTEGQTIFCIIVNIQ